VNLEETLRQTYRTRLDTVDLPGGDPAAARAAGRRMRVRRRVAVGGAALALVAAGAVGALVSGSPRAAGPTGVPGQWRELPTPPLSPRAGAAMVWTGREVVVLGGTTAVCPPTADCGPMPDAALRTGAAYDPAHGTWRGIDSAPVGVAPEDDVVVAAGFVVLRHVVPSPPTRTTATEPAVQWWVYDPQRNHWDRAHGPRHGMENPSPLGPRLYGLVGGRVAWYDVESDTWTRLPADPTRPRLTSVSVTATSAGPVVSGYDATQPNDGRKPSLVLADVWRRGAWHRLPATGQLDTGFAWTGRRLVQPSPYSEDGGQVNGWGRAYPQGGRLDPVTGVWSRLPAAVTGDPDGWTLEAAGGPWFASAGQAYDDDTGGVAPLPRPDGAADYAVSAAWAGDRLVAFGGVDSARGYSGDALSDRAWIFTP
jgi:hypothetical protein